MNLRHVSTLVHLEGRRGGRLLARMYLFGLALMVVFAVLGRASGENILAVIMGGTIGTVLLIPLTVGRDKVERTLEFLLSLPVTVQELVAARFAAAALSLLPGSVATGVALALLPLPLELGFMEGIPAFAIAFAFWMLLTVVAWILAAFAAAFDLSTAVGWPLGIFVGLCLILPWTIRTFGPSDPGQALVWFLLQPFAGAVLAAVATVALIATSVAAFLLACRGFVTYTERGETPL
ncbi:MAG: hypothetical protein F4164_11435 [Gemmatimonadales bacterium]|nr:hypothetical protein [Gemmatimonadales bacterium]MYG49945.1 hypothetical protein [Gemmatimonadales bacterium]MYK01400.1 hypothetical protein [Candidatus Palauibacter ramosifaciens]